MVATKPASSPGETVLLAHRTAPSRSTWFVVRAQGKRTVAQGEIAAVSAPVYVVVDGDERTWRRDQVPRIVDRLTKALDQLQSSTLESMPENENWEAGPVWRQLFTSQLAALGERIAAARQRLAALADEARGD